MNDNKTAGVPALAETTAVFDYSELDEQVAGKLRKAAENVIAAKRKYVFEVAEQVKIAHDLLSNNRNGMFGAWCESVGISRKTGENLLNITKIFRNITSEQAENLGQVGASLMYEVAKPSAPPELVQGVLDGDIKMHKDYIKLKKQLEESVKAEQEAVANAQSYSEYYEQQMCNKAEEIAALNARNSDLVLQIKEQQERADNAEKRLDANKGAIKQLSEINLELEKENKALKNRPVEVAVQTDEKAIAEKDEEIARLRKELNDREQDELFADAFNNKPTSGGSSEEQIAAFYEVLIDKAKYAIKDCVYFITDNNLPLGLRKKLTEKFHNFSDLLDMYYDDLEG